MLRVLCLHGYGTSPEFMKYQLRNFMKLFPEIEFICIPAPFTVPEGLVGDPTVVALSPHKKFYSWSTYLFDTVVLEGSIAFDEGLEAIIDYMNKHGPFDGICGFSQGGGVAQTFMDFSAQGKFKDRLKVKAPQFILLCSSQYFRRNNDLTTTPSIHLIGDRDFLIDASILVTTKYLNPLVLRHTESHKFPRLSQFEIDAFRLYLGSVFGKTKASAPKPKL